MSDAENITPTATNSAMEPKIGEMKKEETILEKKLDTLEIEDENEKVRLCLFIILIDLLLEHKICL